MTLRRVDDPDALAWNADGLLPVVVQEIATGAVLMLAWADREAVGRTLERGEGWFWSRSRRELWRKGATSGNTLAVAEVALDCDGDALLYRVDAAGPVCHTGARSCFVVEPGEDVAPRAGEASERPDEGGGGGRRTGAAGGAPAGRPAGGGPAGSGLELGWLWEVLVERAAADPADSYTRRLLAAGIDRIARKVGEEATEVVIAALRATPASPRTAADPVPPSAGSVPPQPPPAGPQAAPAPVAHAAPAAPLAAEAADLLYHLLVLLLAAGVPLADVAGKLRRRHARPATPPSPKAEDGPPPEAPR